MIRNCIAIVAGALLAFLLSFAGTYLMAFMVLRNPGSLTDQQLLMRLTLGTLVVGSSAAVIVGAFFAWVVQRRFWWLVSVAFVPWLIYGLITNIHDVDAFGLTVFTGNVAVACLAAFVISRLKQPRLA